MSSTYSSFLPLAYQEAGGEKPALPLPSAPTVPEPSPSVSVGVPEDEVERRIQIARDAAVAETSQRLRDEFERATKSAQMKITEAIRQFSEERSEYFKRVEGEVVQLALSVARKILQREAELDPALLAALVRVALDRMQHGSEVRIRVAVEETEYWEEVSSSSWKIVADETLNAGDCIVETDLGTANFGFESQLRDMEESFMQLLARRPSDPLRHAATV